MEAEKVSELFDTALPEVFTYLRRRCHSTVLAEDLTSATFIRATTAAVRNPNQAITIGWLITIARNLLVDHWRREALHTRTVELVERQQSFADPWEEVIDAEWARSLLVELRSEHRTVLTLRYLDDLAVSTIAELMDRSVRATESLLVRARAALRSHYQQGDVGSNHAASDNRATNKGGGENA